MCLRCSDTVCVSLMKECRCSDPCFVFVCKVNSATTTILTGLYICDKFNLILVGANTTGVVEQRCAFNHERVIKLTFKSFLMMKILKIMQRMWTKHIAIKERSLDLNLLIGMNEETSFRSSSISGCFTMIII